MMAPRGPGLLVAVVLTAVLGILTLAPASAAPPPFDSGGVMCFDVFESDAECDGDTSPGAAADVASKFCIAWNADCSARDATVESSNSGGLVGFTPTAFTLPKGDTIPVGAISGRLESEAWLGLLNNPCNTRIRVAFTLLNASINTGDTIAPRPEGEIDVMQPLAMDADGNGIPDGADKYPSFLAEFFADGDGTPLQPRARLFGITHIQGSWITQNIVFFEPGSTLEVAQTRVTFDPALGYPAVAVLQDPTSQAAPGAITDFCAPLFTETVVLGKTINNPCTPAAVQGANCPVTTDETPEIKELGYPSFPCDVRSNFDDDGDGKVNDGCPQVNTVPETGAECNNDVSEDAEDSAVNDGCPQVGDVSEGSRIPGACTGADEGGCTYRANPATVGTYTFTLLAMSERDADGDGIENSLDSCVYEYDPEWNPRGFDPVNDPDADGLPSVCDPQPNVASAPAPGGCASGYTGPDEDQDCYSNRQDNCPLKPSLQDPTKPADPATNKPFAPDDDGDGIGDACDKNLGALDGESGGVCLQFALNVGGAGGPVVGVKHPAPAPECAASPGCLFVPCGTFTPNTIVTCSINAPIFAPSPTPSELLTVASDVTVYATVRTFWPLFNLTLPAVSPITFSDEPGLGNVDPTSFTLGSDGIAKTTYRLPAGLTGQAVATVTATTASGKTCSVSFIIKPGLTGFPLTGGDPGDGTAGVLAAVAGGVIALGGAVVLVLARGRRAKRSRARA